MTPSSLSPSNCRNSMADPSSSLRPSLSLLFAFFVFSCIPLAGEAARQGEYCSNSLSHIVECSDPNAYCKDATETTYGTCQCAEGFHNLPLSDANSRYFITQCVKYRPAFYYPCESSLQCQLQDANSLCSYEFGYKICRCRDIDGYAPTSASTCKRRYVPEQNAEDKSSAWLMAVVAIVVVVVFSVLISLACFRILKDTAEPPPSIVFRRNRSPLTSSSITPFDSEIEERPISIYDDATSQRSSDSIDLSPSLEHDSSLLITAPKHPLDTRPSTSRPSTSQLESRPTTAFEDAISQVSSEAALLSPSTHEQSSPDTSEGQKGVNPSYQSSPDTSEKTKGINPSHETSL